MIGGDLFHLDVIFGAIVKAFQDDVVVWMPAWLVDFWHFLVWIDQQLAVQVALACQKFGFFPDIVAVESAIATMFGFLAILMWRRFLYIVLFAVILFGLHKMVAR